MRKTSAYKAIDAGHAVSADSAKKIKETFISGDSGGVLLVSERQSTVDVTATRHALSIGVSSHHQQRSAHLPRRRSLGRRSARRGIINRPYPARREIAAQNKHHLCTLK